MNQRRRLLCAAVAGLLAGLAQAQRKVYRIGYLSSRASHSANDLGIAIPQALRLRADELIP